MDFLTIIEILKAAGLLLIGAGLVLYAVGKIIERRNEGEA